MNKHSGGFDVADENKDNGGRGNSGGASGGDFDVADMKLAEQGFKNIELAESHMGALMTLKQRVESERPFEGLRVAMALHVTKETAVLVRVLRAGGADVWITGCNPLSTQDDVAAAMADEGVHVFAKKGESDEEYYGYLRKVLECGAGDDAGGDANGAAAGVDSANGSAANGFSGGPHITIDDGCDLVSLIHKEKPELISGIIGGCEETTTGIIRLKAMEKDNALKYPIVAVNDNNTKHLMDNYYGTGQSTPDGIMRACNFMFAGKVAVVGGYGDCGKGLALRLKGLGANVIVTEVRPFRALQAAMDGYRVMKMSEACREGDIFVTVTGDIDVITMEHVREMKDGAILANSGHFDVEIDVDGIRDASVSARKVREFMEEFVFENGRKIFLLGEGRLVNLAAAEGHPSDVMSLSFCGQVLACEYLVKNKGKLENRVQKPPEENDVYISELQLKAMGVEIDELSEKQRKYLESWEVGT